MQLRHLRTFVVVASASSFTRAGEKVHLAQSSVTEQHVSKRWDGFGEFARRAPYFSGVMIMLVGLYVGYLGLRALT